MSRLTPKSFRLSSVSLRHLELCMSAMELPSEVAVLKVALANLYGERKELNGWEILQDVQRRETQNRKKADS